MWLSGKSKAKHHEMVCLEMCFKMRGKSQRSQQCCTVNGTECSSVVLLNMVELPAFPEAKVAKPQEFAFLRMS